MSAAPPARAADVASLERPHLTDELPKPWWEPLAGGLMLLPLFGVSLLSIAPIIAAVLVYAMAALGLFLLKRGRAKGLLLAVGASLFVVLKCWDVVAVLNGVPHPS
jgi:hypothetical protein